MRRLMYGSCVGVIALLATTGTALARHAMG
jgi:hypothetical protein